MTNIKQKIKLIVIYLITGIIGLFVGAWIFGIFIGRYIYEHTGSSYRQFGNEFEGMEYVAYGAILGAVIGLVILSVIRKRSDKKIH